MSLERDPETAGEPVTAYNWQDPPFNRWAFWNVTEILPTYQVATWYGLWAPKNTPKEIVEAMRAEMKKALTSDDLVKAWNGLGAETPNLYGDAFGKFVNGEIKRWADVVKASGAKLD